MPVSGAPAMPTLPSVSIHNLEDAAPDVPVHIREPNEGCEQVHPELDGTAGAGDREQ